MILHKYKVFDMVPVCNHSRYVIIVGIVTLPLPLPIWNNIKICTHTASKRHLGNRASWRNNSIPR